MPTRPANRLAEVQVAILRNASIISRALQDPREGQSFAARLLSSCRRVVLLDYIKKKDEARYKALLEKHNIRR